MTVTEPQGNGETDDPPLSLRTEAPLTLTRTDTAHRASMAFVALARSRAMVEPALRAAVARLPERMQRIAGYQLGWCDEHGEPVPVGRGKALRPALTLISAAAAGGDPATAVPAAVTIELVHHVALLRGDLLSRAEQRGQRPATWTVFGHGPTMLAADAMLSLAHEVLAGRPGTDAAIRAVHTTVLAILDGQAAELDFEDRTEVKLAECLRIARNKTASLLACACELGALSCGATPARQARLRGFGEHLGMACQHVDDLLGIWGDPAITGKPRYSDLRAGKLTLPVVSALTSGSPAGRRLTASYLRDRPSSGSELTRAAELIVLTGARSWSRDQAGEHLAEALGELQHARPESGPAAELAAIARLVVQRVH